MLFSELKVVPGVIRARRRTDPLVFLLLVDALRGLDLETWDRVVVVRLVVSGAGHAVRVVLGLTDLAAQHALRNVGLGMLGRVGTGARVNVARDGVVGLTVDTVLGEGEAVLVRLAAVLGQPEFLALEVVVVGAGVVLGQRVGVLH